MSEPAMSKKETLENLEKDYKETMPGNNAKTSDYYSVKNIPNRFDKPDILPNIGNPVFTCPPFVVPNSNMENEHLDQTDSFKGYAKKHPHPMYMTSAMEYGNRQPNVHVMPQTFHAKSQKFSDHLGQCGMYKNYSLNTSLDKNPVSSQLDGLF